MTRPAPNWQLPDGKFTVDERHSRIVLLTEADDDSLGVGLYDLNNGLPLGAVLTIPAADSARAKFDSDAVLGDLPPLCRESSSEPETPRRKDGCVRDPLLPT
jgi:hypothetical protein